jgi:hypothetical protein
MDDTGSIKSGGIDHYEKANKVFVQINAIEA